MGDQPQQVIAYRVASSHRPNVESGCYEGIGDGSEILNLGWG
jgi:hypothetical protein